MGREANCVAQVGGERGAVKALLESSELILRGGIKRRYALAVLSRARVDGAMLRFEAGNEAVELHLGADEAGRWLKKLNTPPPTLAAKLGLGADCLALVHGAVDDAALAEALKDHTAVRAAQAGVMVAVARSEAELAAALKAHAALAARPVWIVHPKGKAATLSDAQVRATLRAAGYVDNKTSAVSDALTATRYARR